MNTRSVGRPEVGGAVHVRLGDHLLDEVDVWATDHGMSRAEAIRRLVQIGISHAPSPTLKSDELINQLLGNDAGITDLYELIDAEAGPWTAAVEGENVPIAVYLRPWRGAWIVHEWVSGNHAYQAAPNRGAGVTLWQDTVKRLTEAHWTVGAAPLWSATDRTDLPALPSGSCEN